MKPEDLKCPFRWVNRKICIHDRVWYIPDYLESYETFSFPGWQDPDLFGNQNPVYVEYCSGNGAWIAEKAAAHPEINWVAVEKKFERVRKIWSKIKNHNLSNLVVICGEAFRSTHYYFPTQSVTHLFINFPDPWPKKRHAKHRLMTPHFIEEMGRIMDGQGVLTLVTDDPDYSLLSIEEITSSSVLKPVFAAPHYITEFSGYGTSYFEELWREKGKAIRYHQFEKA